MHLARLGILVSFALGLASGAPGADPVEQARVAAERAADELGKRLVGALAAALEAGGPSSAIEVCSEKALPLTADVAREAGFSIRRTSLRVRNPANAPDAYERVWLERAEASAAAGRAVEARAEVVDRENGERELRVLRPILFPGAPCASCHGSPTEIGDEVLAVLTERYPEDRATGFRPGDLRGAFSVRVPLP